MASYQTSSTSPLNAADDQGFRVASGCRAAGLPPGDANGDGRVDVNDLTIVLTNFGMTGRVWSQGCMDGDPAGTVTSTI